MPATSALHHRYILESQEGLTLIFLLSSRRFDVQAILESQEGLKLARVQKGVLPFAEGLESQEGLKLCQSSAKTRRAIGTGLESQEGLKSRPGRARIYAGPPGGRISVGTVNGVRRR